MSETPLESPAEDAAEQRADIFPDDERLEVSDSMEVDEADAADQARVVPARDDDYE